MLTLIRTCRRLCYRTCLRGSGFECLFCGTRHRRFLPAGSRSRRLAALQAVGIGRRDNACCPECGASDRARLLFLYLRDVAHVIDAPQPLRVLHVAPNEALARALQRERSLDITWGSLDPADFTDFDAVRADIMDLPFAPAAFDWLLCNHVLQQVPDDRRALREIRRVLRPDGHAIVQVPLAPGLPTTDEELGDLDRRERRRRFGSTQHFRLYGEDIVSRFAAQGLRLHFLRPSDPGWQADCRRYALNAREAVMIAEPLS